MRRSTSLLLALLGVLGVANVVAGTLLAFGAYAGPYTLLNLTISELGQEMHSPAARRFNAGLMVGGVCIAAFLLGVSRALPARSQGAFALLGGGTGLTAGLVGVFPLPHPAHAIVGPACFVCGLLASVVCAAALRSDPAPVLPRWLAGASVVVGGAMALYVALSLPLLRLDGVRLRMVAPGAATRPPIWSVAVTEWLALGAMLLWVFLVAASLVYHSYRAYARPPAPPDEP